MNSSSSLVIVGAGHAGFQLAQALRQARHDGAITLVNNEPHPPYQRPPLSKTYLKTAGGADSVLFRPVNFFADQRIELISDTATAIDRAARTLQLGSGATLAYDHLVLATGARNRELSVPGSGDDIGYIRTLAETEALRLRLPQVKHVVIVGAGFIGLEFAATARALGVGVDVIEVAPRIMGRAVTPQVSAFFQARHEASGVRFHFGVGVSEIERRDGQITAVVLANGTRLDADIVVAGIGVIPNVELAAEAGLAVASGIVVDEHLLTGDPAISAIGDCAAFPSPHAGAVTRIESVQNATDQARCVAARLTGKHETYCSLPWFWSDQGSDKLQIVGLTGACDSTVVRGDPAAGAFSVFCYAGEQLIGIESINRAGDHALGRKVFGAGRNIPAAAAADASVDLRQFAG